MLLLLSFQTIHLIISFLLLLTMAGANRKTNAFLLAVKHHIEALHDDCAHHGAGAGLGHSKLVAVLLGRGHIFHWPQVLLHREREERKKYEVALDTRYQASTSL